MLKSIQTTTVALAADGFYTDLATLELNRRKRLTTALLLNNGNTASVRSIHS